MRDSWSDRPSCVWWAIIDDVVDAAEFGRLWPLPDANGRIAGEDDAK